MAPSKVKCITILEDLNLLLVYCGYILCIDNLRNAYWVPTLNLTSVYGIIYTTYDICIRVLFGTF